MRHPVLQAAVDDVRDAFPGHEVTDDDLSDGSVWVTIKDLRLSDGWSPSAIDLSVKVPITFPSSPPYPYYAAAGLTWNGGQCPALQSVEIEGTKRTQISLLKPYDPDVETLGGRLVAVRHWMRSQ
jgi:hypothetical protein